MLTLILHPEAEPPISKPGWKLHLICEENPYWPGYAVTFDMTTDESLSQFLFNEVKQGYERDGGYVFERLTHDHHWRGRCPVTDEVITLELVRE